MQIFMTVQKFPPAPPPPYLVKNERSLRDENDLKFPTKSPRVSSDVALRDHDIFPCNDNKVSSPPTEKT